MSCRIYLVTTLWLVICTSTMIFGVDISLKELASHMESPRSVERIACMSALAQCKDPQAITIAISGARLYAQMNSDEVKVLAVVMANQSIENSIALLSDKNKYIVDAAILDLGMRAPEQLLPVVKDLLGKKDEVSVELVRRILAVAIAQAGKTPAFIELALLQFQDTNEYRRQSAVRSLQRVERLDRIIAEHIAKDNSEKVRVTLVDVLETHLASTARNVAEAEAARWIRELLYVLSADMSEKVRYAVFDCLQDRWHDRLQGEGTSEKRERDLFFTAFSDLSPSVRNLAIRQFSIRPDEAGIAQIQRLAADPEGVVASVALDAARSLGLANLSDLAFKACSLPHPQNRQVGLQILVQQRDARVIPVATRLLDDPDSSVRWDASKALKENAVIVEVSALALAQVAKLKPAERQSLLMRLAQQDPPERLAEINKLYQGMSSDQRRELMVVFARDVGLARSVGEFLLARTSDADAQIAMNAFKALGNLNGKNGILGLPEAMNRKDDRDPKVAEAANGLLQQILQSNGYDNGIRFESVLPDRFANSGEYNPDNLPRRPKTTTETDALLKDAVSASKADKWKYFQVLASVDDERVQQMLEQAARDKERVVRWAALDALVRRGDQSDAVLDYALARLLVMNQEDLQMRAVWPAVTKKLLDRLKTFSGVAEVSGISLLKKEIERRLAALAAAETLP